MSKRKKRILGEYIPNKNRPYLIEAEKQIDAVMDEAGLSIKDLAIANRGEPVFPFSFWTRLAGGPINLHSSSIFDNEKFLDRVSLTEKEAKERNLSYFINGGIKDAGAITSIEAIVPKNKEIEISMALCDDAESRFYDICDDIRYGALNTDTAAKLEMLKENIRLFQTETAKYGCISIPVVTYKHSEEDCSPSLMSLANININYSSVNSVSDCLYDIAVSSCLGKYEELWEKYDLSNKQMIRQFTIQTENHSPISDENFSDYISLIAKIIEIYNDAVITEFNEMKNDPEYQKRHELKIS